MLYFFFGAFRAPATKMIACVSIVAKENSPLLLRVFPQVDEEDTKFHHICYCSIDVFEEREQAMRWGRCLDLSCSDASLRAGYRGIMAAAFFRPRTHWVPTCRATAGGGARQIDTFLGVLYLVQDYKVYGYVTNTGVRFILVVDDSDNKDARYCKPVVMPV